MMRPLYSQADSMSTSSMMTSTTASTTTSSSTRPLIPRQDSISPPPLIVRALYDYHSPDATNLSFQAGTLIRVLTQLQSGWWDGCIDGERGWFPCNFVTEVDGDSIIGQHEQGFLDTNEDDDTSDTASGDEDDGERALEGDDDDIILSDFAWVPQADKEGRTFFLNTQNGETSWELPGARGYSEEWEGSRISDDEEIAPRTSIDSEASEGILMLGPTLRPEYSLPDFNVQHPNLAIY